MWSYHWKMQVGEALEVVIWDEICSAKLDECLSIGFVKGRSSPCAFWHPRREIGSVVHGDNFTNLGYEDQLDWLLEQIRKRFDDAGDRLDTFDSNVFD